MARAAGGRLPPGPGGGDLLMVGVVAAIGFPSRSASRSTEAARLAAFSKVADMLWFFDRDEESLRLEARYDNDTFEFVTTVTYPDGSERTERFRTLADFRTWMDRFDQLVQKQHWASREGAIVLPYGWPNKRLT
jgi:hypothetical protein